MFSFNVGINFGVYIDINVDVNFGVNVNVCGVWVYFDVGVVDHVDINVCAVKVCVIIVGAVKVSHVNVVIGISIWCLHSASISSLAFMKLHF